MKWHCIRGTGYCFWSPYSGWTKRIVNTTFLTTDPLGIYDKSYLFEITVMTSRGRGSPYQLSTYIPPLYGVPEDFRCYLAMDNTHLFCHWSPPNDVSPFGFNVSITFWVCRDGTRGFKF